VLPRNAYLIQRYINKRLLGLLELDATLPGPAKGERYLWEMTAGTGVVPKWVSLIGLCAVALFVAGAAAVIVAILT
jgi:hypothetical protein